MSIEKLKENARKWTADVWANSDEEHAVLTEMVESAQEERARPRRSTRDVAAELVERPTPAAENEAAIRAEQLRRRIDRAQESREAAFEAERTAQDELDALEVESYSEQWSGDTPDPVEEQPEAEVDLSKFNPMTRQAIEAMQR